MICRVAVTSRSAVAVRPADAQVSAGARVNIAAVTVSTRWPEAHSRAGLVASPHALASEAGAAAFDRGGNAVDAALAAAITLTVVYPHMNGLGGDAVWLIFDASAGRLLALNAAGRSAVSVDLEAYRTRYGNSMPTRGGTAAMTVPGVVSGWDAAHRYSVESMGSKIAWRARFEAALRYADGFPASASQRRITTAARDLFGAAAPADVQRTLWPV